MSVGHLDRVLILYDIVLHTNAPFYPPRRASAQCSSITFYRRYVFFYLFLFYRRQCEKWKDSWTHHRQTGSQDDGYAVCLEKHVDLFPVS